MVVNVALKGRWEKTQNREILPDQLLFGKSHITSLKMADEEQVEVRIGEEAGAGKVKRKSIKKAARDGILSIRRLRYGICFNFLL